MATNWNTILSNTKNLNDVLAILRKILGQTDKLSELDIDGILANIDAQVNQATSNFDSKQVDALNELKETLEVAKAAGAGANGWITDIVATKISDAATQDLFNQKGVTTVETFADLAKLDTWDLRLVYVSGDGQYYYSAAQKSWLKDEPYAIFDFKNEQPVQYYYNKLGNWDDAIFEAQCNIYRKGFSSTLKLPVGNIEITHPIYGGRGLIEYMAKNAPDIDTSGQWIPLTIFGAPRSTEGRPESNLGTQIVFKGIKSDTDLTWANYGIIHCASLDYQNMQTGGQDNPGSITLRDVNVRPDNINTGQSSIHGMVVRNGSKHYLQNVTFYGCYGSGFYGDWFFDSQFDQVTFMRCGRMSPDYKKFMSDGNLDVQYQTYAPLQITHTSTAADNSNFIFFHKTHFEDNTYGAADIIINGDSTPIIMYDNHHETEGNGVASKNKKVCVALGGYGVKYFGQDQESGFDYTNFDKQTRAGYVTLENARVYSPGYEYLSKQTAWCTSTYNSCNVGGLPVYAYSYNSGGGVTLNDTPIGDFIHEGFSDRGYLLRATQGTIGDIYLGKDDGSGGSVSLVNCDCGNMSIGSNSNGSWASSIEIRATNTSFNSINGNYPNFFGDIELTSSSIASRFAVINKADLDIRSYNFLETSGV